MVRRLGFFHSGGVTFKAARAKQRFRVPEKSFQEPKTTHWTRGQVHRTVMPPSNGGRGQ